jgi:hypothetical protein
MAAWNAVLRPAADIPLTPYYLAMPAVAWWLLWAWPPFTRWCAWFLPFAAYGLAVGTLYGVPIAVQVGQLIKHFQLLTFFGLLSWLCTIDPRGHRRLLRMVTWLLTMVFAIAALQSVTGWQFPTVVNEESDLWLNTFFFTPNDLGLFLGGALCLLLCSRASPITKIVVIAATSYLNLRNDAKAVLLATALMLGIQVFLYVCEKARIKPIVGVSIFVVLVPWTIVLLSDSEFEVAESTFDFLQLFLDPLERIAALEPYDLGGSIFDRTDALIYCLQALKSTYWLGLGPGGSVYTLSLPNFELLTAKSLHNAIAELLVEFGPAMLLLLSWLVAPVFRLLWKTRLTPRERCMVMLLAAAPMLSVSQSSGYISNYAFWLTAFLIWSRPAVQCTAARHHRAFTPPDSSRISARLTP